AQDQERHPDRPGPVAGARLAREDEHGEDERDHAAEQGDEAHPAHEALRVFLVQAACSLTLTTTTVRSSAICSPFENLSTSWQMRSPMARASPPRASLRSAIRRSSPNCPLWRSSASVTPSVKRTMTSPGRKSTTPSS